MHCTHGMSTLYVAICLQHSKDLVLHGSLYSFCTCYLIVLGIQESQNAQEQIYKVEVEVDGSKDVLVGRQLPHQHVGVKDDESTEQQSTTNRDDQLKGFTPHKHLYTDNRTLCTGVILIRI